MKKKLIFLEHYFFDHQMFREKMKKHGTKKKIAEITKAKTPLQLAKIIVKKHTCKKCGKNKSSCKC